MNISGEIHDEYLAMLAAFKSTLTSADEQLVFEEAIICDFREARYKEWLLNTGLSVRSRNERLRTLGVLMNKLIKYVELISPQ